MYAEYLLAYDPTGEFFVRNSNTGVLAMAILSFYLWLGHRLPLKLLPMSRSQNSSVRSRNENERIIVVNYRTGGFLSPGIPRGSLFLPFGCGSKLNRRGKPQVLVHVSTLPGQSIVEFRSFWLPRPILLPYLAARERAPGTTATAQARASGTASGGPARPAPKAPGPVHPRGEVRLRFAPRARGCLAYSVLLWMVHHGLCYCGARDCCKIRL